jgi:hypothetical protein
VRVSRQRDVVDYALQRRALLGDLTTGRRSRAEACDAHPYLLLAAKHYGETISTPCPVCDRQHQRHVHYVYGNALGRSAGQARSVEDLARMAREYDEFDVYVVEVCPDCNWNHLVRSFALGQPGSDTLTAADG